MLKSWHSAVKPERSGIQGQFWLHKEFKVGAGYMRPCLKETKYKTKNLNRTLALPDLQHTGRYPEED